MQNKKNNFNGCPSTIGEAKVICYTLIDEGHQFTASCKQIAAGKITGSMYGLAICQYEGEDSFYLFGCYENWESITDTWHQTLEEAIEQAEFEYKGTKSTWIKKA